VGLEILFLALVAVAVPAAFAMFAVVWWTAHRAGVSSERAWIAFARTRGFDVTPGAGEWPNRRAPVIAWREDGASFRLEARGREGAARTCVVARLDVPPLGELRATPDGAVDVERPAGLARRLFNADVRRALASFDTGDRTELVYANGEVCISWRALEASHARLDEAIGVVRRAVWALALACA
jgi:hypothetical protein